MDRRSFIVGTGAAAAGAAMSSTMALAAMRETARGFDPVAMVDPELRARARATLAAYATQEPLGIANLAERRKPGLGWPINAAVPYERRLVPGPAGAPDVGIYLINAKPGGVRPVIVHTHGGGFVLGSAKEAVGSMQMLATALDCTVVTIDYRLAPETRWSGSVEDNYAALLWTYRNASALGVDPARIAVMGESAGGGHAALLAIASRDRGEVPLVMQVLLYPMLDDRTGSSRQVSPYQGNFIWHAADNRFAWEAFLGAKPGGRNAPRGAVPARVADLTRLAPAFIGVGSLDLFVDEDIEYARRLDDAGVATELHVVPRVYHGFDNFPFVAVSRRFNEVKMDALRRAFAKPA